MDYELERCSRHCVSSGRELTPGEAFYSVLVAEGAELHRYDYSAEAWRGPPENAIGWWRSQIPGRNAKRKHWAPNDVMLEVFDELADQPDKQDVRYVLALLLVRRRVLRQEDREVDQQGREVMVLYCPRREATYQVPVLTPNQPRIDEIQEDLTRLLE